MKEATLNKKVEQIQEVLKKFEESKSAVFVDYLGLTVAQVSDLRNRLYQEGCEMKVVKKNCTLPSWLCYEAEKATINFSQALQAALKRELNIADR